MGIKLSECHLNEDGGAPSYTLSVLQLAKIIELFEPKVMRVDHTLDRIKI